MNRAAEQKKTAIPWGAGKEKEEERVTKLERSGHSQRLFPQKGTVPKGRVSKCKM